MLYLILMGCLLMQICCISPEFSGFPLESSMSSDSLVPDDCMTLEAHNHHETARLATVPEGRPLTSESSHQVCETPQAKMTGLSASQDGLTSDMAINHGCCSQG